MRRPCFSAADTDGDAVPGTPLSARATLAGGVQPTAPAVAADVCVTSAASPAETITPAAVLGAAEPAAFPSLSTRPPPPVPTSLTLAPALPRFPPRSPPPL